jgi:hypothetical protein
MLYFGKKFNNDLFGLMYRNLYYALQLIFTGIDFD